MHPAAGRKVRPSAPGRRGRGHLVLELVVGAGGAAWPVATTVLNGIGGRVPARGCNCPFARHGRRRTGHVALTYQPLPVVHAVLGSYVKALGWTEPLASREKDRTVNVARGRGACRQVSARAEEGGSVLGAPRGGSTQVVFRSPGDECSESMYVEGVDHEAIGREIATPSHGATK